MTEVISWHNVSPQKRIILSKRFDTASYTSTPRTYFSASSPYPLQIYNQRKISTALNKVSPYERKTFLRAKRHKKSFDSDLGSSISTLSRIKSTSSFYKSSNVSTSEFSPKQETRLVQSPAIFVIEPGKETSHDLKSLDNFATPSIPSVPSKNDSKRSFSSVDSPKAKYIVRKKRRKIQSFATKSYGDLPQGSDDHGPALIDGVNVPEVNEEINDAYDDLIRNIGESIEESRKNDI